MNKKYLNAAVAVLLALGINACSSGGSESVGISQEENRSIQAVNKITEINETLNTQLTEAVAIPKNCEKKPLKLRKLTPKIFSLF